MARKSKKTGIIVFVAIIIAALAVAAYSLLSGPGSIPNTTGDPDRGTTHADFFKKNKIKGKFGSNYIAALYIEGTIEDANKTYNQSWLLDTINDLKNDNRNVGILLYINSPGGGVYEADGTYLALENYKKCGKPVYAYLGPLAASGGYYIACAADKIYANRNTLTGSIGVIAGESVDLTGLMNKYGVKVETITAGKNKNMLNFNCPLTDEQRAIMQEVADDAYDQFTGIVAESRKLKIEDVKKLADGRIYTAHQAERNGLIDQIDSWDDTVTAFSKAIGTENYKINTFKYERDGGFFDLLTGILTHISGTRATADQNLADAVVNKIKPDINYPAYIYQPR